MPVVIYTKRFIKPPIGLLITLQHEIIFVLKL